MKATLTPVILTFCNEQEDNKAVLTMQVISLGPPGPAYLDMITKKFSNMVDDMFGDTDVVDGPVEPEDEND